MTNLKIHEHNCETGEIILRDMTTAEMEQYQKDLLAFEQTKKERMERETQRQSALAKLSALGLTSDDLRVLGL